MLWVHYCTVRPHDQQLSQEAGLSHVKKLGYSSSQFPEVGWMQAWLTRSGPISISLSFWLSGRGLHISAYPLPRKGCPGMEISHPTKVTFVGYFLPADGSNRSFHTYTLHSLSFFTLGFNHHRASVS